MQPLTLYDEQTFAVADALAYYEACDYGCGDQRPLTDEQAEHVRQIKDVQGALDALTSRVALDMQAETCEDSRAEPAVP